jgi:predicted outer membrane repeat protein
MCCKIPLKCGPAVFVLLLVIVSAAAARTIYVDADATGANNGSSWADGYIYLQDALAIASVGDEIRVAGGVHWPDQGCAYSPGDRAATFQLRSGVAIRGGYAGFGQANPDARNFDEHETILSGDLNSDDVDVADAYELLYEVTRAENSHHVVTASGTDKAAVLDGFTITGGNANPYEQWPSQDSCGGGMYNVDGRATLINCVFIGNVAEEVGGAMYNHKQGNATLDNCTFASNSATAGGAVCNWASSPTFTQCTFRNNSAMAGGGMCNYAGTGNCAPELTSCTFTANSSEADGGAVYNDGFSGWCRPALVNCIFNGNSAGANGGAVYSVEWIDGQCSPTLTNCTLVGNSAGRLGGAVCGESANTILANCILWGNSHGQIAGDVSASYSDVEGGWPGEGNIDANPYFADPSNGDFHLKSKVGRWDPYSETWLQDVLTSPCIDAGDPNCSCGGELWPSGKCINMGAYGGTAQASMSRSTVGNVADFDNNDLVDAQDLSMLAEMWLAKDPLLAEDIDRDGLVSFCDFAELANNWRVPAE